MAPDSVTYMHNAQVPNLAVGPETVAFLQLQPINHLPPIPLLSERFEFT